MYTTRARGYALTHASGPSLVGCDVASSTVFVGPDDCNGDTMLKPEHAATFAAFVADAQQRHVRGGVA